MQKVQTEKVYLRRALLALLCLSMLVACASLPDLPHSVRPGKFGYTPTIVKDGREMTPLESERMMSELLKGMDNDLPLKRHLVLLEVLSSSPLVAENKATLLINGKAAYPEMLRAIKNAKDHINVESYIFEDEDQGKHFAELLINKQAEGVQVNIIYDSIGSRRTSSSFFKSLESAGVAILEFNRIGARNIRNPGSIMHRNHRKMLIVDGRIAFTGGMNISDVYLPSFGNPRGKARPWRDTQVKIEGPAVETFQRLFLDTWMREGQPPAAANYYPELTSKGNALVRVIGSRPGETNRLNYLMYLSAVTHATRSIYLTVSYFAPDENLLEALERSVERGVDVKIVLPGKTDIPFVLRAGQAHYKRLLEAGVKLYQRQGSILHAKTAVVDGVWSKVGSTNLEFWSLLRSNEVDAIILDPEFGKAMEKVFNWDLKYSDEITLDKWQQRPMSDRIKEWCARLITYWL